MKLSNPDAVFDRYDVLTRGSRGEHETFETMETLRDAVRAHLSPSELRSGVLERLTDFDPHRAVDGVVTLKYRSVETWASLRDPD